MCGKVDARQILCSEPGDHTIVHLRQDGTVVARRRVEIGGRPMGALRLNGIAGSPDRTGIWVNLSGPVRGMGGLKGAVLEVPAF